MIDATVIIATHNRCHTLKDTLLSLAGQRVPDGFQWEALIVDNNSRDETRSVIDAFAGSNPERFRYVFEGRQGKSYALNTAITKARGAILAFTDDDLTLDPCWLANLVTGLRESGCGGAGGRIEPVWVDAKPRWLQLDGPYRLGSVIVSFNLGPEPCLITDRLPLGANIAITADAFLRRGFFRTDLGPTVGSEIRGEDSELCRRLLNAGEQLIYVPNAVAYHPVDRRRLDRKYFERYYFAQGRAVTREEGLPPDARRYWGVPRYLLRSAGRTLAQWMLSFDVKRRFYHKLQFCYVLGRMAEARRQTSLARQTRSLRRVSSETARLEHMR